MIRVIGVIYVLVHGLIHLIGVVAFWQIVEIKDIPYKTTVLNGRIDIGENGTRILGALWLIATLGFVIAAFGMAAKQDWWQTTLLANTLLSLALTILGLKETVVGIAANVIILIALLLS
jgi:hypothetical protein